MNDIFGPVARVMEKLQGISVPPWKAYRWVQQLISWLEEAAKECDEGGNMDFFPENESKCNGMQQSFYIVLNSHYIYRIIRFS